MVLKDNLLFYKIIEILLIIFPLTLLFSNVIAELILLLFILLYFKEVKITKFVSDLKKPIILFLLVFWIYLIINYLINFQTEPSIERALFFFRFILMIVALNYFINNPNINLKKIFDFWIFIFFFVSADLFLQFFTHKNILGYAAIQQGSIYRLGGIMDNELKISNLIYHFGALIFSYHFSRQLKKNNTINIKSLIFLITITVAIFLTAERANFVTMLSFISLFILFYYFKVKKFFFLFLIVVSIAIFIPLKFKSDLSNRMINDLFGKVELFKPDKQVFYLNKDSHYFAHYSAAYQIYERNKIFGVGLKNFRKFCDDETLNKKIHPKWQDRKCATHPHHFILEILSEIGLVGFFLIFSFFIFSFFKFLKIYKKTNHTFLLLSSFILIVYFIPFLPKGSFFTNWNAIIFWFIYSFIYSNYTILSKSND